MRQAKENKLFLVLSSHLQRKEKLLKVQHILSLPAKFGLYYYSNNVFISNHKRYRKHPV